MAKGMAAASKAADQAQTSGSGRSSGKLFYWNWKDGDTKILRFITDDVITCDFYEFVHSDVPETNPQTFLVPASVYADDEGNIPPEYASLTDWVKELGGKTQEYGTKKLIDVEPKKRTVAMAVLQEEAPREVDGKVKMFYQDVIEEIEVNDQTYPARQFGIVKQAYKNFWVQLVGYFHEFGTICDRPYKITRRGGKNDTVYQIIPLREDPDFDIKELQDSYGYGETRDEEDDERFLYCPQTLDQWAEWYGSEERVKRHLLGEEGGKKNGSKSSSNGHAEGRGEFHKDTTSNPEGGADEAQAAPPPAPASRDYNDLRSRLGRHKK